MRIILTRQPAHSVESFLYYDCFLGTQHNGAFAATVKGLMWSVGGAIPVACMQAVPMVSDNVLYFRWSELTK
jgi:hypothetical protein